MSRQPVLPAIAVGVIAVTVAGCETHPTAPTRPGRAAVAAPAPAPAPSPAPYVDPGFPPAPAGAAVYGRTSPSSVPGSQRYVLFEDGRFGLQYLRPDAGFHEYAGRHAPTGTGIHLVFDANGGSWQADATFDGDLMLVRYNLVATFDDFEDGAFARQPAGR